MYCTLIHTQLLSRTVYFSAPPAGCSYLRILYRTIILYNNCRSTQSTPHRRGEIATETYKRHLSNKIIPRQTWRWQHLFPTGHSFGSWVRSPFGVVYPEFFCVCVVLRREHPCDQPIPIPEALSVCRPAARSASDTNYIQHFPERQQWDEDFLCD